MDFELKLQRLFQNQYEERFGIRWLLCLCCLTTESVVLIGQMLFVELLNNYWNYYLKPKWDYEYTLIAASHVIVCTRIQWTSLSLLNIWMKQTSMQFYVVLLIIASRKAEHHVCVGPFSTILFIANGESEKHLRWYTYQQRSYSTPEQESAWKSFELCYFDSLWDILASG